MAEKYIDLSRAPRVEEALRLLEERARRVEEKTSIPTGDAAGLVLAEPVRLPYDWPPANRAAYDGYAVRSADTPGRLRLVGSVEIGSRPGRRLGPGETVYVTTGSLLPEGADAVVPEERARVEDGYVVVEEHYEPGSYVDLRGSIARRGETLLEEGTVLTILDVAGLLEAGIAEVTVYRPLRYAIISTGNELVIPGDPQYTRRAVLEEGKVAATTGSVVAQFLADYAPFAQLVYEQILPDELEAVAWTVERVLPHVDLVLLTGGTGPSRIDLFYRLQDRIGGELVFRGLYVIGGKPTSAYVVEGKPVIGLSGYPLSALHATIRLVLPLLRYMARATRPSPMLPLIEAELRGSFNPRRPRPLKARLYLENGRLVAEPLPREHQRSSANVAFTLADALILTGEEPLKPGDRVRVLPYREPREG